MYIYDVFLYLESVCTTYTLNCCCCYPNWPLIHCQIGHSDSCSRMTKTARILQTVVPMKEYLRRQNNHTPPLPIFLTRCVPTQLHNAAPRIVTVHASKFRKKGEQVYPITSACAAHWGLSTILEQCIVRQVCVYI